MDDSAEAIIATGIRVFPEGVDNFASTKEVSRNEQRRTARSMRRQIRRRGKRKAQLREALVSCGLFPADPAEQQRLYASDPYELRARALSEALQPHEIGRVLLHLNQRRGFQSMSKRKPKDKETSDMLAEISELAGAINKAGGTLGEFLHAKTRAFNHCKRIEEDHVRSRHTRRAMLVEEFVAICDAQRGFGNELLTEPLCYGEFGREASLAKLVRKPIPRHDPRRRGASDLGYFGLFGLIFFHRPMYWPRSIVGLCELEPKQKRCARGHRLAQRFRLLQEVNNLRYIDPDARVERTLDPDQRALLLEHLATRKEATFDQLRKRLGFDESVRFNMERGKRPKLTGMITDWAVAKAMGKQWHDRDEAEKNGIVEILLQADTDPDAAAGELIEQFAFTGAQADTLLSVELQAGYSGLSLKAIRKLLPHLEAGLPYMANDESNSALHAAGYLRRDELQRRIFDRLPMPERMAECKIGDIPNPVVKRALVELRKVVNAIIREYGKPDAIHVEMARSAQLGGERRKEYIKAMRDREARRDRAADELRKHRLSVNGDAITRYLLWERQATKCMYCGRTISLTQLFGGDADVDHVLPESQSLDDSQGNKVVCHRRCNADKGQRTVHQWLAASEPERYERICQQALSLLRKKLLPYGTYKRLLQKNVDLEDFTKRQLVDTGYIARATVEYLHCLFDADHAVLGLKGQYTAKLRHQWGLETILAELPDSPAWQEQGKLRPGQKNRADHRHHAIDAIVLALTNRSRLQELARHRRLGCPDGIDRRTGEVLEVSPPWDRFRQSVVEAVRAVNVSHRVRRRVAGGLHEDTFYGPVYDKAGQRVEGRFVVRKPLADLSPNEIPLIRDKGVRRVVEARLADAGLETGRGRKLDRTTYREAVAGLTMPSGVPIRKVRVYRSDLTIRPIREGTPNEAWVKPGSNHHLCIFQWQDNGETKREAVFVSRLEAARRVRAA
ncbi:MAG: type II CRISPR RNA-guided endonuclease Cas9, partial [Alphaproteobacteria bacterium]